MIDKDLKGTSLDRSTQAPTVGAEVIRWYHADPLQRQSYDVPRTECLTESLATEVPVALNFNGINHVVLMASPVDLADLALGFSLSEGLIDQASDLYDLEIRTFEAGWSIELEISSRCFERLKEQRRHLIGRTGCGLCGLESLQAFDAQQHLIEQKVSIQTAHQALKAGAIQRTISSLSNYQTLFEATGAVHAAAFADEHGTILACREDVGRHNALDKLLGALARLPGPPVLADGFVVMSSRASYELIHKCAAFGIRCLATVSAPTSLAVEQARKLGICLVGFARENRMTIYSHQQWVDMQA